MTISLEQLQAPPRTATHRLLDHYQVSRRGVVHVGAHRGEELELYLSCAFERVLYLEANPEMHSELEKHLVFWRNWLDALQQSYGFTRKPELESWFLAAGAREERTTFHLTRCSGQSSLLKPAMYIEQVDEIEVPVRPLDALLAGRLDQFSLLVIDVQGAELLVLQGATELLSHLEMVVVEVNFVPRYQGVCSALQIDDLMEAAGFRAVVRSQSGPEAHGGDVVYVRGRYA